MCHSGKREKTRHVGEAEEIKEMDGNLSYDSDSVFAIGPSNVRLTVKVAILV